MRALVTGCCGFVSGYLIELLEDSGHEVYGFDIKHGQDFRDYEQVRTSIDTFRPDWIFHIGAQAFVPESFIDPYRAFEVNTIGSLNILEAVRRLGLKTRIHLAGSSEELGDTPHNDLIDETALPNPLSPYAIAKLAMTQLGLLYARAYDMNVVVTRTFNHTGPGRGEMYAEGSWAKQIVEIERGTREVLEHGDLTNYRNYTDVRDIVRAYIKAIELPSGLYNVCSDQNIQMKDVLNELISQSKSKVLTRENPNLLRPADFSFRPPVAHKFRELTDWEPTIPLKQSLTDILEDWRSEL
jgi:GDP-4-dehydro-6-deoxy-D-mannose reductase